MDEFRSDGYVMLNRSVIEGRLDCSHGSFHCGQKSRMNPDGHAVQAIATTARGGMALGWTSVAPSVDFTDAATTVLEDDPANWPATVLHLRLHLPALRRAGGR